MNPDDSSQDVSAAPEPKHKRGTNTCMLCGLTHWKNTLLIVELSMMNISTIAKQEGFGALYHGTSSALWRVLAAGITLPAYPFRAAGCMTYEKFSHIKIEDFLQGCIINS